MRWLLVLLLLIPAVVFSESVMGVDSPASVMGVDSPASVMNITISSGGSGGCSYTLDYGNLSGTGTAYTSYDTVACNSTLYMELSNTSNSSYTKIIWQISGDSGVEAYYLGSWVNQTFEVSEDDILRIKAEHSGYIGTISGTITIKFDDADGDEVASFTYAVDPEEAGPF
jgi:hypothetical protein